MQAPPPSVLRPHWIPFEPAWIVIGGLVLLAVLPHQVPRTGRRLLGNWIGVLLGLALVAWLFLYAKTPVLAIALLLFIAGVHISTHLKEGFHSAPILVKDQVPSKKPRWFQEEVMSEDPHGIQERTEEGGFLVDEIVSDGNKWEVESVLGEEPTAIQERPVAAMDSSENPYATGVSQRPGV
jgi:hypothetical protein